MFEKAKVISSNDNADKFEETSKKILSDHKSNEFFVALVGPAGAGAGTAARTLISYFQDAEYQVILVKASELIRAAAENFGWEVPSESRKSIDSIRTMQDRGDDLRRGRENDGTEDHAAVARYILKSINEERKLSKESEDRERNRVFVIDSLRHPAEVQLLRSVYRDSFALIGVVCDPGEREKRIRHNLFDRSKWSSDFTKEKVEEFLKRDENAPEKFGQHVSDTFFESDFFVDNSQSAGEDINNNGMNDQLRRFVSLITHDRIVRPNIAETAMHQARSAQMRSACLSRQVGAALVDRSGNVVATGTNEAPKAGGGVYGEGFEDVDCDDHRCAYRATSFCSSNREQNRLISELLDEFSDRFPYEDRGSDLQKMRKTSVGGLLEFSRAVHAEMDAILSAAMVGVSPRGCRLFVTTYPCHYCARHIVAAGIDEVQFVEPYPKSLATELHDDAITISAENWVPPSQCVELGHDNGKVLFRPFVGVAPRLYRRVFLKDRSYKDKITGDMQIESPEWESSLDSYKISYLELEERLGLGGVQGRE